MHSEWNVPCGDSSAHRGFQKKKLKGTAQARRSAQVCGFFRLSRNRTYKYGVGREGTGGRQPSTSGQAVRRTTSKGASALSSGAQVATEAATPCPLAAARSKPPLFLVWHFCTCTYEFITC